METKCRSVVARSWRERGHRKSLPTLYRDSVWGDGKVLDAVVVSYSIINVINATEPYTQQGQILCYI